MEAQISTLLDHHRQVQAILQKSILALTDASVDLTSCGSEEAVKLMDQEMRDLLHKSKSLEAHRQCLDLLRQSSKTVTDSNDYQKTFEQLLSKEVLKPLKNNQDYLEFRKKIWETSHPDEQLPDPSALTYPFGSEEQLGEEDEEMTVVQSVKSFTCPISFKIMVDPVSSTICRHSYSKKAIFDYIKQYSRHKDVVKCPVSGCDHTVNFECLKENKILARRIAEQGLDEVEEGQSADEYEQYTMME